MNNTKEGKTYRNILLIYIFAVCIIAIIFIKGIIVKEDKNMMSNELTRETVSKSISSEYLIIVNKENQLQENNEPDDLVIPDISFNAANFMTQYVREEVAMALEDMFDEAKLDNINLVGVSAYRSYDYQEELYDEKVSSDGISEADKYVAKPGYSEHQSGLAIDVLSTEYSQLDEGFEDTEAFKWLQENMSKYGFILRYPLGKEEITGYSYEPWHLRYVGTDVAKYIMDNNITLEEFFK